MPEFILRVGTPDGDVVERHVRANSLSAARDEMAARACTSSRRSAAS